MTDFSYLQKLLYAPPVKQKLEDVLQEIGKTWGQYCRNSSGVIEELKAAKLVARPKFELNKSGRHKTPLLQRNKTIIGMIEQYAGRMLVIIPWNHDIFPPVNYTRQLKRGSIVQLPAIDSAESAVFDRITPDALLQEAYAERDLRRNYYGYSWSPIGDDKHVKVTGFLQGIEGKILADAAKGFVQIDDQYSDHAQAAKYGHRIVVTVPSVSEKGQPFYDFVITGFPAAHEGMQDASYAIWPNLHSTHACKKTNWMMVKWIRAKTDIDAAVVHGSFQEEDFLDFHVAAGYFRAMDYVNKQQGMKVHINPFFVNPKLMEFQQKLKNNVVIEADEPDGIRRYNLAKPLLELLLQKYVVVNYKTIFDHGTS